MPKVFSVCSSRIFWKLFPSQLGLSVGEFCNRLESFWLQSKTNLVLVVFSWVIWSRHLYLQIESFVGDYNWITICHVSPSLSASEFSNLFPTFTNSSLSSSLEKERMQKFSFFKNITDHQCSWAAREEQVEHWWYHLHLWLYRQGSFSSSQVLYGSSLSSPEPPWSTSFFSQSPVLCLKKVGRDRQCCWSALAVWASLQKSWLPPAWEGGLTEVAGYRWRRSASVKTWRSCKWKLVNDHGTLRR